VQTDVSFGHLQSSFINHPINKKRKPQANAYMQSFSVPAVSLYTTDSSTPSADAVGDTTQGLEIGPFRELVVLGRGRDVCADNADGEVGDVGEGDFSAVELRRDG
jgi:hypothetical protein